MIVNVHGGPTGQTQVVFTGRFAYWLSRGWAVLVPDHRGSTGWGRAYTQAMRGSWGTVDVDDTVLQSWRPTNTTLIFDSAGDVFIQYQPTGLATGTLDIIDVPTQTVRRVTAVGPFAAALGLTEKPVP